MSDDSILYEPPSQEPEGCRFCRGSGVCLNCEGRGCSKCHDTGECPRCDGEG